MEDLNLNFSHSKIVQLSFKSQTVSSTYAIGPDPQHSTEKIVGKHSDFKVGGVLYALIKPFLGATLLAYHLQGL